MTTNILTFGEKLELAFDSAEKSTKMIGAKPVSFVIIIIDGIEIELIRSVAHPWFWKVSYIETHKVVLLKDEWDLPMLKSA